MKQVVIIPTFNEAANIKALLLRISAVAPKANVLVVDDSSPDGTAEIVRDFQKNNPRLSLLVRQKKEGLGRAYLAAFQTVLKDPEVESVVMMDADFSHNPDYVPAMLDLLSSCDMAVGSRYVQGGGTSGWEAWRRLLSFFGNLYCKIILRMPVFDATAGFSAIRAEVLRQVDLSSIGVSGYAFQVELKYLLFRHGARLKELPIIFVNRVGGESKISGHIVNEGILAPWKLLFKNLGQKRKKV